MQDNNRNCKDFRVTRNWIALILKRLNENANNHKKNLVVFIIVSVSKGIYASFSNRQIHMNLVKV